MHGSVGHQSGFDVLAGEGDFLGRWSGSLGRHISWRIRNDLLLLFFSSCPRALLRGAEIPGDFVLWQTSTLKTSMRHHSIQESENMRVLVQCCLTRDQRLNICQDQTPTSEPLVVWRAPDPTNGETCEILKHVLTAPPPPPLCSSAKLPA